MTEVKEDTKTSNSHSSAYIDTVEGELRCKSICLAQQVFCAIPQSKIKDFCQLPLHKGAFLCRFYMFCILTVGGFFDTLKAPSL